jgi:predicted metalloprotease
VKWRRGAGRGQVEDRRGAGGFSGGIPIGVGGGGIGVLVLVLVAILTGNVPGGGAEPGPFDAFPPAQTQATPADDPERDLVERTKFIVEDVQATWQNLFRRADRQYDVTLLVLFRQATQSGCGFASADVGPHYCPSDRKVYLDLAFFRDLRERFGAPGDFAQAYVIAHEFGHHVQNILGIMERVENREDSIRLELQADCLAGVWAHSAAQRDLLDPGDLEEGLGAAAAVGDDRIQQKASGRIDPESWTHGSSDQRMKWFHRGFDRGDPGACDTFSGDL